MSDPLRPLTGIAANLVTLALIVVLAGCAGSGSVPISGTATASTVPAVSQTSSFPPTSATTVAPATTSANIAETTPPATTIPAITGVDEYDVVAGAHPHDVAVAGDGTVWYTAQAAGRLDRLDPVTGEVTQVSLGSGSAPHGVIFGPDQAAWVTDQGLNAIVRVDHTTLAVDIYPAEADVGMHTPVFAPDGTLWFTGQQGYYGRLDPATGTMELFETGGGGPYGITATPAGEIYFAALSGSYIAHVDPSDGEMSRIDPPTPDQGARRVWSDSNGRIWVSYWNTGHVAVYDPAGGTWEEWPMPGDSPQAYAIYVDATDRVWVSDFGGDHALLRFDPGTETFESIPLPTPQGAVRQILGRPGEVWGAESAADALVVVRY